MGRTFRIPYGRSFLTGEVPEANFRGIFEPGTPAPAPDPESEVRRALEEPIGSPPLEELARGKLTAVVIASDHTRPVPSRVLMPQLLERLRRNNPGIDVTILVATGFHRETTRAELISKFGEAIVASEKIVVHDSRDESALRKIGTLPSGGVLQLNALALDADLLLAEGFIEPHFFAGFSGGRKSILPGIASRETVLANHCAEFIASPFARTGNLRGNPIHRDMLYAAKQARLAFILNVVIDSQKRIVRAFAGASQEAHEAGCAFVESFARVEVPQADIVVTGNGGYPLDQNVYQSVKGMTAAEAALVEGGVVILCAECADGHGGESFYRHLAECSTPAELLNRISSVPRNCTEPDQWEYQILCRILAHHPVILVSDRCDATMLRAMKLEAASSLDEALERAFALRGKSARLAVLPDGVASIVRGI